ncbi:MMPL family transporter [Plantactinospora soyae]|uniref:RND superfamily putative drug exporter n=1 Tax=Plantactinospora soyae TaxID=1544732 RepID=A0A927R4E5_9ACTN|nr:MMPL family transporter [Plantactinospora soyae]MBE1492763.1 RND superfamily putative drug exporter [Plantactinospora soyae]
MAGSRSRVALLVAAVLVVGWLVVGVISAPYAGRLSEVATNDNAAFLPADAEATRGEELAAGFVERETIPALVVYARNSGITDADRQQVAADAVRFAAVPGVVGPLPPPIPSEDGKALQVIVPVDNAEDDQTRAVVMELRRIAGHGRDGGQMVVVGGPAGLLGDLIEVFSSIDGPLLLVTLVVVLVILLVVYRSPVLWIIPLLAAGLSYALAALAVYFLAQAGVIMLNGQAQGILTVLVFGAGTDYALLFIARYREELCHHKNAVQAMLAAWRGAAPAIFASGGTVIAGLLCLLLSSLTSNQALGPVAAVGIGATLVVMLTFLPALLMIGGRWAFWPRSPYSEHAASVGRLWKPIAHFIARRARLVWVVTTLVLIGLGFGLTQLGATRLGQTELFTNRTDSVIAQEVIDRHYPGGLGSPVTIFTLVGTADRVTEAARSVPGVAEVHPQPAGDTNGTDPGASTGPGAPGGAAAEPKVVDGRVQLQATLTTSADSEEAEETVRRLRVAVHAVPDADAVVGGFTAISVDTADASDRDRNVIIPAVLGVIAVILALLLRALLAPVVLILTVVLSFLATLGLCALLFQYVFGFPGVDASFPLFAFVFLVALGIDYNIFLMSRVREESVRRGTRSGVLRGLVVTGGVITSAGIVLAATFSALAVLPLVILIELGLAVALGVLLDTIIVRSLLVPALTYDIGSAIWWPSRLSRERHHPGRD